MTLWRETPCDHGSSEECDDLIDPAEWLASLGSPAGPVRVDCPGRSRVEVTINYKAAVLFANRDNDGMWGLNDLEPDEVKGIVNAALGVTQ